MFRVTEPLSVSNSINVYRPSKFVYLYRHSALYQTKKNLMMSKFLTKPCEQDKGRSVKYWLVQTCPILSQLVQTCPNCYIDACLNQNWKHICLHYEPYMYCYRQLLSKAFWTVLLLIRLFFHGDRSNQDFTNIIYDLPFISTSTEYPPIRSSVHYSLSGITNEWVIWLLLVSSQP